MDNFTNSQADLAAALVQLNGSEPTRGLFPRAKSRVDPYGRDLGTWQTFCDGLSSGKSYKRTVDNFCSWVDHSRPGTNLVDALLEYFEFLHNVEKSHNSTSLRSFASIFQRFWEHTNKCKRGDFANVAPMIFLKLDEWDKKAEEGTKQAEVLTKGDYMRQIQLPHTAEMLPKQVYAIVSVNMAGRGCEVIYHEFEDFEDKGDRIEIKFQRKKQAGRKVEENCRIVGELEMEVFRLYISCFPESERTGRFFRKLTSRKGGGTPIGTKAKIGHNMGSNYGKDLAQAIGKENYMKFTGHCWRRSAATWMADAGLSLAQIKVGTGITFFKSM